MILMYVLHDSYFKVIVLTIYVYVSFCLLVGCLIIVVLIVLFM